MRSEQNRAAGSGIGIGISSILMVFVILCLVVFAVLSLVSANADHKLGKQLGDHTAAYYEACAAANETLDKLDETLAQAYDASGASDAAISAYQDAAAKACTDLKLTVREGTAQESPDGSAIAGSAIDGSASSGSADSSASRELLADLTVSISEEQNLCITLSIPLSPKSGEPYFDIISWQAKPAGTWEPDNHLNLIGM